MKLVTQYRPIEIKELQLIQESGGLLPAQTSHAELWVPAEDLAQFNEQIQGPISVLRSYCGRNILVKENAKP